MITTLCYLEKDNKYLMLHRTKKENDINKKIRHCGSPDFLFCHFV